MPIQLLFCEHCLSTSAYGASNGWLCTNPFLQVHSYEVIAIKISIPLQGNKNRKSCVISKGKHHHPAVLSGRTDPSRQLQEQTAAARAQIDQSWRRVDGGAGAIGHPSSWEFFCGGLLQTYRLCVL
jgi:hypothetical protein